MQNADSLRGAYLPRWLANSSHHCLAARLHQSMQLRPRRHNWDILNQPTSWVNGNFSHPWFGPLQSSLHIWQHEIRDCTMCGLILLPGSLVGGCISTLSMLWYSCIYHHTSSQWWPISTPFGWSTIRTSVVRACMNTELMCVRSWPTRCSRVDEALGRWDASDDWSSFIVTSSVVWAYWSSTPDLDSVILARHTKVLSASLRILHGLLSHFIVIERMSMSS